MAEKQTLGTQRRLRSGESESPTQTSWGESQEALSSQGWMQRCVPWSFNNFIENYLGAPRQFGAVPERPPRRLLLRPAGHPEVGSTAGEDAVAVVADKAAGGQVERTRIRFWIQSLKQVVIERGTDVLYRMT